LFFSFLFSLRRRFYNEKAEDYWNREYLDYTQFPTFLEKKYFLRVRKEKERKKEKEYVCNG